MTSGIWVLLFGSVGCAGEPATPACDARVSPSCAVAADALGLRVALLETAKSICVAEEGCAGEPKGSISIQPLAPSLREVVSDALVAAGFQLVHGDAERDVAAAVEWRGTDTIALRLQDIYGRLIDETSYRRSLDPCRALAELNWDTCWAANFPIMKEALSKPFQRSTALHAFAHKGTGGALASAAPAPQLAGSPAAASSRTGAAPVLAERLSSLDLQETVARYREETQRSCWVPASAAREPTTSTSARVSATVTINPAGTVDDIKTDGDPPGYLHLATCLATQVRGWRFPSAKNATTASIPFVFTGD